MESWLQGRYDYERKDRLVRLPFRAPRYTAPVNAIVDNFDHGLSAAEIAEQFEVAQDSVEAILAHVKSQRIPRIPLNSPYSFRRPTPPSPATASLS
jgi:hypothetical protein